MVSPYSILDPQEYYWFAEEFNDGELDEEDARIVMALCGSGGRHMGVDHVREGQGHWLDSLNFCA